MHRPHYYDSIAPDGPVPDYGNMPTHDHPDDGTGPLQALCAALSDLAGMAASFTPPSPDRPPPGTPGMGMGFPQAPPGLTDNYAAYAGYPTDYAPPTRQPSGWVTADPWQRTGVIGETARTMGGHGSVTAGGSFRPAHPSAAIVGAPTPPRTPADYCGPGMMPHPTPYPPQLQPPGTVGYGPHSHVAHWAEQMGVGYADQIPWDGPPVGGPPPSLRHTFHPAGDGPAHRQFRQWGSAHPTPQTPGMPPFHTGMVDARIHGTPQPGHSGDYSAADYGYPTDYAPPHRDPTNPDRVTTDVFRSRGVPGRPKQHTKESGGSFRVAHPSAAVVHQPRRPGQYPDQDYSAYGANTATPYGHDATCGQCGLSFYLPEDSQDFYCPRCGASSVEYAGPTRSAHYADDPYGDPSSYAGQYFGSDHAAGASSAAHHGTTKHPQFATERPDIVGASQRAHEHAQHAARHAAGGNAQEASEHHDTAASYHEHVAQQLPGHKYGEMHAAAAQQHREASAALKGGAQPYAAYSDDDTGDGMDWNSQLAPMHAAPPGMFPGAPTGYAPRHPFDIPGYFPAMPGVHGPSYPQIPAAPHPGVTVREYPQHPPIPGHPHPLPGHTMDAGQRRDTIGPFGSHAETMDWPRTSRSERDDFASPAPPTGYEYVEWRHGHEHRPRMTDKQFKRWQKMEASGKYAAVGRPYDYCAGRARGPGQDVFAGPESF